MPRSFVRNPLALVAFALAALVAAGCSDPVTTRLTVDPASVEVARGESVTVTAHYVRNGVEDPVGSEARWESALPTIAAVSPGPGGTAMITGVSNGATQVTIRALGLKKTIQVSVVAPAFVSLAIDPPSSNVAAGLQVQLTASARLADGSTQVVSGQVAWMSSEPTIATVDATGEVTAHAQGTAVITVTLGALSAFATVTVGAPRLTALQVTPATPQVAIGATQQMNATGTFTDGSMRDVTFMVQWSSSVPDVATVSPAALVTGVQIGNTTISARMGAVFGSTVVTVVPPVLSSITVTPASTSVAAGLAKQYTATGRYTDGTTADVTAMVTWSSTAIEVATISNAAGSQGRATAVAMGTTTIRATVGAISGETTLTVTAPVLVSIGLTPQAAPNVPLGRRQQFMATGVYSDGSMMNLTDSVTWGSTQPAVATISNAAGTRGLAESVAIGSTTISATSGMVSGVATMIVTSPAIDALRVEPADSMLAVGATRQLRAIGTMSDGSMPDVTAMVMWTSSVPARATITNPGGLARGVAVGATTITASSGAIMGSTTLTVTPVELVAITVTPAAPTVIAGQTQQFTATGRYSDDSTMDLTATATWASSVPAVATISAAGLATTLAGGTTTISATAGAISGSTTLTSQAVTVIAFAPAAGATSIRPTTPVSFTFSQAMDPTMLFSQIQAGPCAGNLQLSRDDFASCLAFTTTGPVMSAGNTVATLQPEQPLVPLATYKLRASASATAATGIPMTADVGQAQPFSIASDGECAAELVISQVYGGGGNTGAPILHDFIELHNPGPTPVSLAGKAVQFVNATGTGTWAVQALPAVDVPAGGYFLIQEAAGAGTQPALADPDFQPMSPFAMGATSGKVALTASTTPLTGGCPLAQTLDLVGYGATATCFEGAAPIAMPGTSPQSNQTAVLRNAAGCTDRNDLGDLATGAPAPRNGMTPPAVCVCWVNETDLQAEVDYCNLQFPTVIPLPQPAPFTIAAVFGRVYEAGVTEAPGASPKVWMSVGFGVGDSDPRTWPWTAAVFNVSVGNDDEYQAPITFTAPGDYDFTTRATRDGTNWTLCDIDGAGSNGILRFDQFQTGSATITP
jgi:hypothetical protein